MSRSDLRAQPSSAYRVALAFACAIASQGCDDNTGPAAPTLPEDTLPAPTVELDVQLVYSGFQAPLLLTQPPGDPRIFVVEQGGRIRQASGGGPASPAYLDLTGVVGTGGERGLLGLAFHPDFAQNRALFVSYTDAEGASTLARFQDPGGGAPIDPATGVQIFRLAQPFSNHNGGHIAFGPDGFLYLGLGDGGSGGDPLGSGQDTTTLLGSLVRIDVDNPSGGRAYGIPADNPFVGQAGVPDELWAYGLRNPWRFSFDAATGLLYVGDVGQSAREEVSVVDTRGGGYNFGWNLKEGELCFSVTPCDRAGLTDPVLTYENPDDGCSVTGGFVYRGQAIPEIAGTYFYSDFCRGWLRSFRLVDGAAQERTTWIADRIGGVTSFGVDAEGELYVLTASGDVYRIVRRAAA